MPYNPFSALYRDALYLRVVCIQNCHCVNLAPNDPPQVEQRPQASIAEDDGRDVVPPDPTQPAAPQDVPGRVTHVGDYHCSTIYGHPTYEDCIEAKNLMLDSLPPLQPPPDEAWEIVGVGGVPEFGGNPVVRSPAFWTHGEPFPNVCGLSPF